MDFLLFILLALLGLLAPSVAAPSRRADGILGAGNLNLNFNLNLKLGRQTAGKVQLVARVDTLLKYKLICPEDGPEWTPYKNPFLKDNFCNEWAYCDNDGGESQSLFSFVLNIYRYLTRFATGTKHQRKEINPGDPHKKKKEESLEWSVLALYTPVRKIEAKPMTGARTSASARRLTTLHSILVMLSVSLTRPQCPRLQYPGHEHLIGSVSSIH